MLSYAKTGCGPLERDNTSIHVQYTLSTTLAIISDGTSQAGVITGGTKVIRLETGEVTFTDDEARNVLSASGDAYTLTVDVDTQRIEIVGRENSGVFYGIVSLGSLAEVSKMANQKGLSLSAWEDGLMEAENRPFDNSKDGRRFSRTVVLDPAAADKWMTKLLPEVKLTQQGTSQPARNILFRQGDITQSQNVEAYSIRVSSADNTVEVIYRTGEGAFRAGQGSVADQYLLHELQDPSRYTTIHYYTDNVVNPCLQSTYTPEKDRLKTNVEFPGLKVQFRVEDESNSKWLDFTPDIKFDADQKILLRTMSPDGSRVSREVKVTTAKGSKNTRDGTVGLAGSRSTVLVVVGVVVAMVFSVDLLPESRSPSCDSQTQ
ncbi:hypothetical protein RRG08_013321 [Elysia crispata]|uniref:Chitobiase C-terminal domain-containing protein n=1 Tax=Elysia crispata TaxID=231223 RepID=A0AAE1AYI3_9GAST|nr:hypothetical protein RRG08_013321 [Elysia crispata]